MKRLLTFSIVPLLALQIFGSNNSQPTVPLSCRAVHSDAAVNTLVSVVTPTPGSGLSVYICALDYSVSQDGTGAAQTNVKWTTTNFWGWSSEYSQPTTINGVFNIQYQFPVPIKAQAADLPVTLISPAVDLHAAYSVNLYYAIAP